MAEQERDQHFEQLLDSLLQAYSDADPRPGLETRILAGLNAQAVARKSPLIWLWAGAGAAVAVALVMAILLHRAAVAPQPPKIAGTNPAAIQRVPSTEHTSAPTRAGALTPSKQHASPMTNQSPVASVRQDIFPTPAPLSEQEQLLLRYLRTTPREEVVAQSQSDRPVEPFADDQSYVPGSKPENQQFSTTR
ncbi:MAG TPA: hypothetical protein VN176_04835 [Verrucomicrobiae bacterium]|jgi:hypothetical protein|nr:hypothetical protein [Verrucomicrobiae bacterium]